MENSAPTLLTSNKTLSLSQLRESRFFVDKTQDLYNLCHQRRFFLLTRPNGFGKTTVIKTLKELFLHGTKAYDGQKSFFKGLAIEGLFKDDKCCKVLHLAMPNSDIRSYVIDKLDEFSKSNHLEIRKTQSLADKFSYTLEQVADSSLVLLVDDYDQAFLNNLEAQEQYQETLKVLNNLLKIVKVYSQKFRFVLFTGITSFKDEALLTYGSVIKDISYDKKYSSLLGFTQDDFEKLELKDLNTKDLDSYSFDKDGATFSFSPSELLHKAKGKAIDGKLSTLPAFYLKKMKNCKSQLLDDVIMVPIEKFNTNTSLLNIDIRKVLFDFGILTFSRAADDDYYYLKYVSLDKKQQVIEFLNTN